MSLGDLAWIYGWMMAMFFAFYFIFVGPIRSEAKSERLRLQSEIHDLEDRIASLELDRGWGEEDLEVEG